MAHRDFHGLAKRGRAELKDIENSPPLTNVHSTFLLTCCEYGSGSYDMRQTIYILLNLSRSGLCMYTGNFVARKN